MKGYLACSITFVLLNVCLLLVGCAVQPDIDKGVTVRQTGNLAMGLDAAQRGDYASALKAFKPLAELEDANAQYALGYVTAQCE